MKVNKKYVMYAGGILLILSSYMAMCLTTISYKADMYNLLAIGVFIIIALLYIAYNIVFCKEYVEYFTQIRMLNFISGITLLVIILRDMNNNHFSGVQKYFLIMFLCSFIICEFIHVKKRKVSLYKEIVTGISSKIKQNIGLVILLAIFCVFSVYSGGTPYKWDARLYYLACQELNGFSISSLAIYGHIAQTFGIFTKIGTVIWGNVALAAYLNNVILACASIIAFYGILKHFYPFAGKIELVFATGTYAFSSYVLGLVNYMNLDYYCACIFPILVYVTLKQKWIYHIGVAVLFCFTKEPAIIIYVGICLAWLIWNEKKRWSISHKVEIKKMILTPQYWYMILVGGLWLCTYKLLGPWSAGVGGVALDFMYVSEKLKVMYVMNFSWIFTILCLLSFLRLRYKRNNKYNGFFLLLLLPLSLFTMFSCFFRTANHYRYNDIVLFVICIVSMLFILSWKRKWLKTITFSFLCAIMILSSYMTIDPISKKLFENVSTGNGYVLSTSEKGLLGDSSIYNKQMLYLENAVNMAICNALEKEDVILIQAKGNNPWYFDGMMDYGDMTENVTKSSLWWDITKKQRVELQKNDFQSFDIYHVMDEKDIACLVEENKKQKIYSYIIFCSDDIIVRDYIANQYSIIEEDEYNVFNWKLKQIRFVVNP